MYRKWELTAFVILSTALHFAYAQGQLGPSLEPFYRGVTNPLIKGAKECLTH